MNVRPRYFRFLFLPLIMVFSEGLMAQQSSGSAFGESVELSINTVFSLVTVEAQSGPLPSVSESTPPPFNSSDSLLSVDVNANLKLLGALLPATTVGILSTGVLNVETTGDTSPAADSSASVDELDLDILGDILLLPLVVGISADTVTSTASASGSRASGLSASGTTTLENASLASTLAQLLGITGSLVASPAPNLVLLDIDLLGGHLRIVLNEQILSGDGVTSRGITVNAIHITLEDIPVAALITDINGDVIIAQSQAQVTCAEADISITKADSADPVISGQPMFYTLTIHNDGPDDADNVVVEDLWPATASIDSIVPSQGSCDEDGDEITCNLGAIVEGGNATITINGTPNSTGLMTNTVTVRSDAADPNPDDNEDTENTAVNPAAGSADLAIVISDSPDPVTAGDELTITLDITNGGPNSATNTEVVYDIPPGVSVSEVTPSQGSCVVTVTTVTCNLGTVPDGGTPSVEIVMTPLVPATLVHNATVDSNVADPDESDNDDTEESTVIAVAEASADISVQKSDSPDPVNVGQSLTYTLTIENDGPDDAGSVLVTDTLPSEVTFVSANPSQGSCKETDPGIIVCNLGGIDEGDDATVTIVVVPNESGSIDNVAVVVSDVEDGDEEDNSDTESTIVDAGEADLSITKDSDPNPVAVNSELTYTLTINNGGPDDATLVHVEDTLPADVEFVMADPSQGSCSEDSGVVSCDLGTVLNGDDATIIITVIPSEVGSVLNTVIVSSEVSDPDDSDNTATNVADVILGRATFTVTKEFADGDNPTGVEVTIDCFTGLPISQSQEITETQGVEFVVTDFDNGELDCEITEEELPGYTPTYEPDGSSDFDGVGGCNFHDVEVGAENFCHIVNDADFVDIEIEKVWVIDGAEADQVDTSYKLTLYCDAVIDGGEESCYGGAELPVGDNGGYQTCKKLYGDSSQLFVVGVRPDYPSSHCWVDETVDDSAVEIDNDCSDLVISAGEGDSCVITNSVFFEGIPTLNQYGMAILALLMLGVGLVGFRRFA